MATTPAVPQTAIQDLDRGFKVWNISEIYTGTGRGQFVPNVDDLVYDNVNGFSVVQSVDGVTLFSTLAPATQPNVSNNFTQEDILLGAGPGTQSESYRMQLNGSVLPHTLTPDGRLHMYGSTNASYKVFLGADISSNGQVISQYYDQAGNFVSENIPMELVQTAQGNNLAIKAPAVGYTLKDLPDGELLTMVFYDNVGGPRTRASVLVQNSAYVRKQDASLKHIQSIELISPYISPTNPSVIQFPVNMPVSSLPMFGQVNYSDGSSLQLPVDGTKFELVGLNNFVATTAGQNIPLVLLYTPSSTESVYGLEPSANQRIPKNYTAHTLQLDGTFTVKLYGFPRWINAAVGYVMEYYLYTLDRTAVYYATPYVSNNGNAPVFNGLSYGTNQNLSLSLDLSKLDPSVFTPVRFVATLGITLNGPGSNRNSLWDVNFTTNQVDPYGPGLAANFTYVANDNYTLDISCGLPSLAQWLKSLYRTAQPLIDPRGETSAPEPNYMALVFPTGRYELPVNQWNQPITTASDIPQGQLLYIEFFKRGSNGDQQLSIAALPAQVQ